jgi:hypothetical protein
MLIFKEKPRFIIVWNGTALRVMIRACQTYGTGTTVTSEVDMPLRERCEDIAREQDE